MHKSSDTVLGYLCQSVEQIQSLSVSVCPRGGHFSTEALDLRQTGQGGIFLLYVGCSVSAAMVSVVAHAVGVSLYKCIDCRHLLKATYIHKLCCECQHLLFVLGSCVVVSRKQSVLKVITFNKPVQQVRANVSLQVILHLCFVKQVTVSSCPLLENKTLVTSQAVTLLNICCNSWYPNVIGGLQSCNFVVEEKRIIVLELFGHLLDSKHPCSPKPVVPASTATVGCGPHA